jgi:hypothetical protein
MPLYLNISIIIYPIQIPFFGMANIRMPIHQHRGEFSESIKDILTGILPNIQYPIKILDGDDGGI